MPSLPTRQIAGVDVSIIGYGAMSITGSFYSPSAVSSDDERLAVLDAAYATGCKNWDLADVYRDAEELVGKWFKRTGKRSEIFVATKCGVRFGSEGAYADGTPAYIKEACAKSLDRLGIECIDLFYLHRLDRRTPIEHSIQAMAELVQEGKVKAIGVSNVTERALRRAAAVHPITAVQDEYSPFSLYIERNGILDACRELGITFFAYSPLGRGLLTGCYQGPDDFDKDDDRGAFPQFSKENFPQILKLVDVIKGIGEKHSATAGQVTLAWLLAQNVIPIPGTRSIKYMKENVVAADVKLTTQEMQEIRIAAEDCKLQGDRQPAGWDDLLPDDTPLP